MHFTITYRQTLIPLLLCGATALSACGYKADVYYPTEQQRQELKARDARIAARKAAKQATEKTSNTSPQTTNTEQQATIK